MRIADIGSEKRICLKLKIINAYTYIHINIYKSDAKTGECVYIN